MYPGRDDRRWQKDTIISGRRFAS
ncbi:MAG: hypothetical protein P8X55_03165 [Desulfosarcinaceae bacterium]